MQYKPDFPYLGEQIIITSGRVILNSKDDSVFIFGKKAIGLSSAGTINFDSDEEMIFNGTKIYLGLEAKEPLVKGEKLKNLLEELLISLNELGNKLTHAKDSNNVYLTSITTAGQSLKGSIERITPLLKDINSDKNFTI